MEFIIIWVIGWGVTEGLIGRKETSFWNWPIQLGRYIKEYLDGH